MGNMVSMASRPVSMGVFTGCRSMMAGAAASMGRYSVEVISPLPSMGSPRALMTRPKKSSPTGMPAVLPLRWTMLPSTISSPSPKSMQPISSRRSSCTMPLTPEGNRRISP